MKIALDGCTRNTLEKILVIFMQTPFGRYANSFRPNPQILCQRLFATVEVGFKHTQTLVTDLLRIGSNFENCLWRISIQNYSYTLVMKIGLKIRNYFIIDRYPQLFWNSEQFSPRSLQKGVVIYLQLGSFLPLCQIVCHYMSYSNSETLAYIKKTVVFGQNF